MRTTIALVQVIKVFAKNPTKRHYGFAIMKETGLESGILYPLLHRMEDSGLVSGTWEKQSAEQEFSRPRRKYYKITKLGKQKINEIDEVWTAR